MPAENQVDGDDWAGRASVRLAECEEELAALGGPETAPRRLKLTRRAERYRALVDELAERARAAAAEIEEPLRLKARVQEAARVLIRDGRSLMHLRRQAADAEENGSPDLHFEKPPLGAPDVEKAAWELLRKLGL